MATPAGAAAPAAAPAVAAQTVIQGAARSSAGVAGPGGSIHQYVPAFPHETSDRGRPPLYPAPTDARDYSLHVYRSAPVKEEYTQPQVSWPSTNARSTK